jgi:hypothetical protein
VVSTFTDSFVFKIICIANNIVFLFMVQNGYGHHLDAIPLVGNTETVFLLYWLVQQIYKVSLYLVKISLALFYFRLFNTIRWFKWVSILLLAVIASYTLITVFLGFFQCDPVSRAWTRSGPGKCIDLTPFWTSNASFSISTDFILLLLPIPLLLRLQIPAGQKLGLIPVFGLGAFVTAVSIVRLAPVRRAAASDDITFDVEGTMWTILELNLASVCASLPWTWVLVTQLFPATFGRAGSRTPTPRSVVRKTPAAAAAAAGDARGRPPKPGTPWSRAESKYGGGTHYGGDREFAIGTVSGNRSTEGIVAPQRGIQKTVDYTVEFSRWKCESLRSDRSDMV